MELLLLKSPSQASNNFLPSITASCLEYIAYDPNYVDSSETMDTSDDDAFVFSQHCSVLLLR